VPKDPEPPDPAAVVLTFLESVGRRSEAELYLKLFRGVPKESFAVVVTESAVLRHARASLVEALRFLRDLGLVAPVVVGMFSPGASEKAARQLADAAQGLRPVLHPGDEDTLPGRLVQELRSDHTPIVHLASMARSTPAQRFTWLGNLAASLASRKVVVVRRRGGLGPHGGTAIDLGSGHNVATHRGGIGVINLKTDFERLRTHRSLRDEDRELLERLATVVRRDDVRVLASVTSPLALLEELFTQKGAGTLIKRGSTIARHPGYDTVDVPRLERLLIETFGGTPRPEFFRRAVSGVYVAEDYRGAAIVEPANRASYLTKFAVEPVAQGEGIGADLWQAVSRDHPALFWRARTDNPVAAWYGTLADGTMRAGEWRVYWRGVSYEQVPALMEDALGRPTDFSRGG
jgi:bifunctional N-acetylglutamate synthase/kinase